ncbi:N-acetylmuramoyl-L-alanine amidase [bacterium]|nr:N-acetylmuramoyl-L-alanine amidase [bacterium]
MPKIFIDAGHGGKDPGAVNGDIYEKDIALQIALKLNNALKNNGFETSMSRSTDVFIPLAERAKKANKFGADFFVSIHLNSAGNSSANGIETLVYENKGVNNQLATNIQNELIKITGATNRGIKEQKKLVVLNSTKMPAVLIEVGFISNFSEGTLLLFNSCQKGIAQAITNGICKYFKKEVKGMAKVENVQDALKILHEKGVINSVDYWVKAVDIVKYLDALIINMANKIS